MLPFPGPRHYSRHFYRRFHQRSLDHQKPLSMLTMAFAVGAYLLFTVARVFAPGADAHVPLAGRLVCALALAAVVAMIPRTRQIGRFGLIGIVYLLILQLGVSLTVDGLDWPLLWALPVAVVVPICAAPLWLTPLHFLIGSLLFYAASVPALLGWPHGGVRLPGMVAALWFVLGASTATVFHFGFYWFRRSHFVLEDRLARLAATDALTGLQNRRAFMEHAAQRLASLGGGERICAIFVDIDRFKSLNDRYGHAIGDQKLYEVAQALLAHTNGEDDVSRIGGEEFALLRDGGLAQAAAQAEKLRAAIGSIARPDGPLSASFGVAEYRRGESIMTLLARADEALLRAKHAGRDRVCVEHQAGAAAAETAQDGRLRWSDYYLESQFQPLFSLSHQKQVGFEALLRGVRLDGERVSPATLFASRPASEEGVLDRTSHVVHLGNASRLLPDDAWLFLNILPATFVMAGYAGQLAELARSAGIAPHRIVLELLESHGGSVDEMSRMAAHYREQGFLIAVDDFGAGHSNLDRLLRIRPDLVKLDGTLIRATSPGAQRPILPRLVSLLHQAGMLVVVEGVETHEELVLAVESNVDFAQGYLLGRPASEAVPPESARADIDRAFATLAAGRARQYSAFDAEIGPYLSALEMAAGALYEGVARETACTELSALARCIGCFLLDESGRPVGRELRGRAAARRAAVLQPVADPGDARWDHRPYFRDAVLHPGVAVASRPYLSLASGRLCIAVTIALMLDGERCVLGAELDWSLPELPWPGVE